MILGRRPNVSPFYEEETKSYNLPNSQKQNVVILYSKVRLPTCVNASKCECFCCLDGEERKQKFLWSTGSSKYVGSSSCTRKHVTHPIEASR